MKQTNLFGEEFSPEEEGEYTKKVSSPIYEPKNVKPHVLELYDTSKTNRLISEINAADIPEDEKKFLIEAAKRHTVFNYSKIADFYAHSSKEVQALMEKSALVIIDFEKAIVVKLEELGYKVELGDNADRISWFEKKKDISDFDMSLVPEPRNLRGPKVDTPEETVVMFNDGRKGLYKRSGNIFHLVREISEDGPEKNGIPVCPDCHFHVCRCDNRRCAKCDRPLNLSGKPFCNDKQCNIS